MSYYEAIEERYNSREPLVGYLLRQKEKSRRLPALTTRSWDRSFRTA